MPYGWDQQKMMYNGGGASTSSGGGANSQGRHRFTADEIDVSEILLSLPLLIRSSESRYRFSVQWGTKKKRSVIESDPSATPNRLLLPSPSPGRPKNKVQASSPATPLSYLPSESDDRPKDPVKKISKRKTREELKDAVDELEKEQQFLKRKLETERARRYQLVAYNTAFKAKQNELTLGFKLPVIETTEEVMAKQESNSSTYDHHKIHRNGLVWPSIVGPLPDLNLMVEDVSQPLDCAADLRYFRVKSAAEARRRRMIRMKEKMKNSSIAVKVSSRC